jgi:hypothetical protein
MAVFVILNAMGQCFLIGPIMLIPCFVNAASNTTPPRLCFYVATCWPFDILAELKYHLFTVVFSPAVPLTMVQFNANMERFQHLKSHQ